MHHSVSWVQVLSYLSFSYLQLCYKFISHNFFKLLYVTVVLQSSETLCVISDGIPLNAYSSICVHINSEAEKANTSVMDALATSLSTSFIFFLFACENFSSLWEKLDMIHQRWKFLLDPEECPAIFLLSGYFQNSEVYNWKIEASIYLKIHNNKQILPFSDICLTQCGTGCCYTALVQVDNIG